MSRIHSLLALGAFAALATAQTTHVLPNGMVAAEGSTSNAFPWGRGSAASLQIQTIYDAVNFTAANINTPIVISRLRWRLNGGVAFASTLAYTQAQVEMATAAVTASTASTTFASNVQGDNTQVYSGPVTLQASPATTPGAFFVDIQLQTPFVYNPGSGNGLVIYSDLPPNVGAGVPAVQMDVHATPDACRVYNSTAYGSGTGTINTNHGVVVEIEYVPAQGLFPNFSANVRSGASPLAVQFTDTSFSSNPGGVVAWQWDFDGDSVIDSSLQNPTHTYTGCGSYNVSLTVIDSSGLQTVTRNNFIVTDPLVASFTKTDLGGGTFQFTDTSTPTPQTWAWDLNGDNVVDSTLQNPTFVYPTNCSPFSITLTTTLNCRTSVATDSVFVAPAALNANTAGGTGTSSTSYVGNLFDVDVLNPAGVSICAVSVTPYTFLGPFSVEVYVTDDTHIGKDTTAAAWRLVGTGNGTATGGPLANPTLLPVALGQSFYLPQGSYGMAIYLTRGAGQTTSLAYTSGALGPFANADLSISPDPVNAPARVRTGLFGGGLLQPRMFNGALHYTTSGLTNSAGYGFFAPGCPSSLGVTNLDATSQPVLGGTLSVQANNLPLNAAISLVGLSNTTSPYGPLPLDLGLVGAPGCFARVRDDATSFFGGAGNTATWNLGIPNSAALLATRAFHQVFVLDIGFNALGAVTSDAAGFVIGQ